MTRIITIVLILISQIANSQFIMAPIVIHNSGGTTSIGGMPIIINSWSRCLVIGSGLSVLRTPSTKENGVFNDCKEIVPVAQILQISVYPNPTSSTTLLKVNGSFDSSLSCSVTISTYDGRILNNQIVPLIKVQSGYSISLEGYPTSIYIISLGFKGQYYLVKIIKTN